MRFFHGTSKEAAGEIERSGLDKGSYVTNDFELAAKHALRQRGQAAVLYFDNIKVEAPEKEVYLSPEFVTEGRAIPAGRCAPDFDASNLPNDYYDLDDDTLEYKYPEYYDKRNWK